MAKEKAFHGVKEIGDFFEGLFDPGADERRAARKAGQRAEGAWGDVYSPTYRDLYQDPNYFFRAGQGDYSLQDNVYTRGPNEIATVDEERFHHIQGGPVGKAAQLAALGYYGNVAAGGPDAVADAAYARAVQDAEMRARGQREAALQQAEMQGMGGSGAGLMADLTAGQNAATSMYGAGMQRAADEQIRRDSATGQIAGMGGQMRDQGLGETQAQWDAWYTAAANNAAARNEAFAGNQQAQNVAAFEDWARNNQTGDYNVGRQNQALDWNQNVPQQVFNNQVALAGGKANAALGAGGIYQTQGGQPFAAGPMIAQTASNVVQSRANPYQR